MKRLFALLMTFVMIASLVACGSKKEETPQSAMEALGENATPAQYVIADFTDKANSGEYSSSEDLANAMLSSDYMQFDGMAMVVEPGYLNGFTDEVTGFKEATMFSPMIGSIPFVGYIFILEDGANADDFVKSLESLADLRWNICTEADEMMSGVVGNMVCFVMSPLSFEE